MVRIDVVDNGGQWTHREWRVLRELGVKTSIIPNTTPLDEIDADGLVLSGGAPRVGLMSSLGSTDEYLEALRFPMLGICAGHQFIARKFGGAAGPAAVPEYGAMIIEIVECGTLLAGIPDRITVWESHNDEVTAIPGGFVLLASSEACRVQAMECVERGLFGLQFHPEVTHTQYGREIFSNFIEFCRR